MNRIQLQPQLLSISRICLCIMIAMCVSASACHASVEPELTTAIRHKEFRLVQTLLSEGVNVNERDEADEQTPLMWAAQVGDMSIVHILLHYKVDVNAIDDSGNSALALALRKGHTAIARLLMQKGARAASAATGAGHSEAAASHKSGVGWGLAPRRASLYEAPHRQVRRSASGAILTLR